jgi:hypothetical protein
MFNFILFSICLIVGFSAYSLNDYKKFSESYYKLTFMYFEKKLGFLIANENSKDEFLIFSEWNYSIAPKMFLQFDIWSVVDLHRLYWIIKFHNKIKKQGLFDNFNK